MALSTASHSRPSLWRLALVSFVTASSGAIMPGPLLVATIEQTAVKGFMAAIWIVTGHAVLELAIVLLLVMGLRAVIARPRVRGTIGLVGGAALVWMGIDMMRHALGPSLSTAAQADAAFPWYKLMVLGAAVCCVNPYFVGWWATIGAGQLAHAAPRRPAEYLAFFLGHEAADYAWYALVALLIVTGRRFLTDGVYRGLILACSAVVILIGVWFFFVDGRLLVSRRETA
ncbi:LysE family transporter [Candidatus Sumerlaeota bacterium]|nr:LysE family transporter [Candidatus Sumerlaeota bacterium]